MGHCMRTPPQDEITTPFYFATACYALLYAAHAHGTRSRCTTRRSLPALPMLLRGMLAAALLYAYCFCFAVCFAFAFALPPQRDGAFHLYLVAQELLPVCVTIFPAFAGQKNTAHAYPPILAETDPRTAGFCYNVLLCDIFVVACLCFVPRTPFLAPWAGRHVPCIACRPWPGQAGHWEQKKDVALLVAFGDCALCLLLLLVPTSFPSPTLSHCEPSFPFPPLQTETLSYGFFVYMWVLLTVILITIFMVDKKQALKRTLLFLPSFVYVVAFVTSLGYLCIRPLYAFLFHFLWIRICIRILAVLYIALTPYHCLAFTCARPATTARLPLARARVLHRLNGTVCCAPCSRRFATNPAAALRRCWLLAAAVDTLWRLLPTCARATYHLQAACVRPRARSAHGSQRTRYTPAALPFIVLLLLALGQFRVYCALTPWLSTPVIRYAGTALPPGIMLRDARPSTTARFLSRV